MAAFLALAAAGIQWLAYSQSQILADSQNAKLKLENDLADCRAERILDAAPEDGLAEDESQSAGAAVGEIEGGSGRLTPAEAAMLAVDYINRDLLTEGAIATSDYAASEASGVYKFNITVSGKNYDTYVTKDGKIVFAQAHYVTAADDRVRKDNNAANKTEKPDVKLFVMSYCPYGLQAQKMYLPVYELLKDKADMGMYFVDYAMHGQKELDENMRQYCIQSEQKDKFAAYLECFTTGDKSADGMGVFDACMVQARIDKGKVTECVKVVDEKYGVTAGYNDKTTWVSGRYPKFAVNDDLNEEYGVQGSPTIIINGKKTTVSPRSPQHFLEIICGMFVNPPHECERNLDNTAAATGFGGGAATASSGGCGG